MEFELRHSKERLAIERRAQPHQRPAIGDSAGAAWAHMRQRLSRAQREARTARRLTIALSCISLAAVAGAITVAVRSSAAVGSAGSAGQAAVRAGDAPTRGLRIADLGSVPTPDPQSAIPGATPPASRLPDPLREYAGGTAAPQTSPVPSPGKPSEAIRPDLGGQEKTPETGPAEKSGGRPGVVEQPGGSEGSPRSRPSLSPRLGRGVAGSVGQVGQDSGSSHSRNGVAGAREGQPQGLPLRLSPQPVRERRPGFRRLGGGSHRTARSSVRRRSRVLARSRRARRTLGRPTYWRAHRVSRAGRATYCLVDPHGNWWIARRVQPQDSRRGEEGK
jgi:hypothetical protein